MTFNSLALRCRDSVFNRIVNQITSKSGVLIKSGVVLESESGILMIIEQSEVAGGAAVSGSWDHMWCWTESEVQQSDKQGKNEPCLFVHPIT